MTLLARPTGLSTSVKTPMTMLFNRRMASASPAVRRILELTGADQVLDTYPTLTAARVGPVLAPASAAPREHATTADFDGGTA